MKNKVLKINIFTLILFFILMLTLEIDYLTYFINLPYIVAFIISLIFNIVIHYFIIKKIEVDKKISKIDIIFYLTLVIIFIITIVYPDRSFDTFNYHLYLQENPFGNKIKYDFFAGKNLNSFSYAFPDRMFYIFRYFLGYRLGVTLNYLLIIVLYNQVKNILEKIIKSNELVTTIISTFIVITISLIDIVDSYYVDLISVILLVEIFRLVLFERINDKNNTYLLGYLALLFGFSIATKISNLPILAFLFIVYIIRNRNIIKYINIKNIVITVLLLFLPFIIYFVYTYVLTGNPIFPFYNTIFHSKYFSNKNWLDTRFGPHRILEVLIYPYIALKNPIRSCDIKIFEPVWCYGYFIALIYFMYYSFTKFIKKKKINNEKYLLVISTIIIYLIWAKFQLGYTRYGFISLILGSICFYMALYDAIRTKKYILFTIIGVLAIYNIGYEVDNYIFEKQDWIYNNYYNSYGEYKYNLKNIFAHGDEKQIRLEKGSVWGIIYENAGLAQMINDNIPIINIGQSADNKYTQKLLKSKLNKASHIYTLVDSIDFNNFIVSMNNYGYRIINVKTVIKSNILDSDSSLIYIFEIKKDNNKINVDEFKMSKIYDSNTLNNKNFYLGLSKRTSKYYKEDIPIKITGIKDGQEIEIANIRVDNDGNMIKINYDFSNYEKIKINQIDKNAEYLFMTIY